MFFIALTLVLTIWSYLYERKTIYNRDNSKNSKPKHQLWQSVPRVF